MVLADQNPQKAVNSAKIRVSFVRNDLSKIHASNYVGGQSMPHVCLVQSLADKARQCTIEGFISPMCDLKFYW
jgi:hypothetical protein